MNENIENKELKLEELEQVNGGTVLSAEDKRIIEKIPKNEYEPLPCSGPPSLRA